MKKIILLTTIILNIIFLLQGLTFSEKQKIIKEQYIKKIQKQYNISEKKVLELKKEIENKFDENKIQLEVLRRLAVNKSLKNENILNNNEQIQNRVNSRFNKKIKNKEKIKTKIEKIKDFVEDKIMGFRAIHQKGGKGNPFNKGNRGQTNSGRK